MKLMVNILLFVFVSFLATPTIVSLLEDDTDISVAFSFSEEEIQKELQEVKMGPSEFSFTFLTPVILKKSKIISDNLRRHKPVFGDIFLPPPEVNIV